MSAVSSAPSLARSGSRSLAGDRRFMNPYLAGFGLGLVLLAAFLIMGRRRRPNPSCSPRG